MTLFLYLLFPAFTADADNQWIQKAGHAGAELLKGNAEGAVRQMVPQTGVNLPSKGYAGLDTNGAYVNQPLLPPNIVPNKYLSYHSGYQARATVGQNVFPNVNHSAHLTAGNRYISNTTTVVPPSFKKNP